MPTDHTHPAAEHAHDAGHAHPNTAEFWDALYGERDQVWSGRPNAVLADRASELPPGRALDLGCGEGGDAIWLAGRGWAVTAVDVSAVAVERARRHAVDAGVGDRIAFEQRDVAFTGLPEGPFDLVSAQFFQSPLELDTATLLTEAAHLVRPAGTMLVVSHAAAPSWSAGRHEHMNFPTPDQTLEALALDPGQWDVAEARVVQREATGPNGEQGTLLDCVVRATRLRG